MSLQNLTPKEKRSALVNRANELGEDNDCTVKALAIVTDSSYDEAHATLKARGRKKGKGTNMGQWLPAVEDLGHHYVKVTGHFEGKTVNSIESELPKGKKFYILVRGHLCAFDGTEVVDWTQGRRHRVTAVYHVAKKKKDLMEENKFRETPTYKGTLRDIIFWYYHPGSKGHGEYRIYFREHGKVRWLNTKYSEWDAEDSAYAAARRRIGVGYEGEMDPADVEQD